MHRFAWIFYIIDIETIPNLINRNNNALGFILQNLQTEACQLKAKMAEIQKDIFQVHKETSASMADLERLDSMKNKLQVGIQNKQIQIW